MSAIERRSRERIAVRCPVEVFVGATSSVIMGMTQNISSGGVYAICDDAIPFCERVECSIVLGLPAARGHEVVLLCNVEVLRSEVVDGKTGIACRFLTCTVTEGASSGRMQAAVVETGSNLAAVGATELPPIFRQN